MIRSTFTFTGHVQGVGFRYTAQRLATRQNVTGWVRNESDGSVRCVVEGEPDEVDRFLTAVQNAFAGCIRDTSIGRGPASGEFDCFSIRF